MSSQATLAVNKAAGNAVETAVTDGHVPELGRVPDDVAQFYDAVATSAIWPSTTLPFESMCVLERGTLVEIKSVIAIYATGSRGRFYFRKGQHEKLLAAGSVYLFAVCKDSPERPVHALKVVPATIVDGILGDDPWLDGGVGRPDYAQLAWSNLFDIEEVDD